MKKLPIGISTLSKLLDENHVYVDKTQHVLHLAQTGGYYFLSRPRRFGKSLLVDTLHQLFAGNENLFRGLHIHPHWDWSVQYPVISISFTEGVLQNAEQLDRHIRYQLKLNRERLQLECTDDANVITCFGELIRAAHAQYGQQAVVLVDEYDKPILDNIHRDAIAGDMRDSLRNLYSVIKGHDAHLRFTFLTGVSKFSKASIFSGLNNLKDITLDPRYATLCGYTQTELEHYFTERLHDVDLPKLKQWYNGYQWLGEGVYNPFDILLFLDTGKSYRSYWFETGTPTFLLKLLKDGQYYLPELEQFPVQETRLGTFELHDMPAEVLLFQTGYLTIHETLQMGNQLGFVLGYPNLEVKLSLNTHLLSYLTPPVSRAAQISLQLYCLLAKTDMEGLRDAFKRFFAGIPHDWYRNNHLDQYEGYYASLFYAHMVACGADTIPEDATSAGQIDLTVMVENSVFVFEFKVINPDQADGSALAQIKAKGYADKYRDGRELYLVGIEFSKQTRNIVGFEWEQG